MEQLDELGNLGEMENYCARLRGETNSKAMEISRMERTALELLRFDRAKKMGIRTSSFPY